PVLPVACCLLPVAGCLLPVACCRFPVPCFPVRARSASVPVPRPDPQQHRAAERTRDAEVGAFLDGDGGDRARVEDVEEVDVGLDVLAGERTQVHHHLHVHAGDVGQAQVAVVGGIVGVAAGVLAD